MTPFVLVLLAATPFPLPGVGGKPLAIKADQTEFRLPLRFEKVRAFYSEQFPAGTEGVTARLTRQNGKQVLTLSTKRKSDAWLRATVIEGELETTVQVKQVIQMGEAAIEGNGKPLVQFVFQRSGEIERAVEGIGDHHLERIRR